MKCSSKNYDENKVYPNSSKTLLQRENLKKKKRFWFKILRMYRLPDEEQKVQLCEYKNIQYETADSNIKS